MPDSLTCKTVAETYRLTIAALAATLFLLQACVDGRNEATPDTGPPTDQGIVERDSTATYAYTIEYPAASWMQSVAGEAIRAWTAERKRAFAAEAPDSTSMDGMPIRPWEMFIRFRTAMGTDVFTSILAEGYEYTGGAHGMPYYEAFNFDMATGRRLTLADFFPDSTALQPISAYVREDLSTRLMDAMGLDTPQSEAEQEAQARQEEWIAEGTTPERANFETFFLVPSENGRAAGITFVLSPYQVAPYAAGTQEVFVPASVFAESLNPAYRNRFNLSPSQDIR